MAPSRLTFTITRPLAGVRLDRAVADLVRGVSRTQARRLIDAGRVTVNGAGEKASLAVQEGDTVTVEPADTRPALSIEPEPIPLDIAYEDEALVIVNKPAGLVVHPAPGHESGTLVNALVHHTGGGLAAGGARERPGIVHRLDRWTSGLLAVAKTAAAHAALAEQFAAHTVHREYAALVWGIFTETGGTIDAPIGRSAADRKRMAIAGLHHRAAVTHFTVEASFRGASELRLRLETGRTHQVRVHCAYIGHGVIGDPTYGSPADPRVLRWPAALAAAVRAVPGQLLHAGRLGLIHPTTGEALEWTAPPPQPFTAVREQLGALAIEERHGA